MFKFLILLSFLLSAAAFAPAARSTRSTQLSMAEKSRALPFLEKPAKLDGSMVGDFGFDPMGISNTVNDLSYVQEAEIKHGRVAMLAVVGFVVQQYIQIVQPSSSDPIKAISTLGYGPNLQVLFAIGCIELINWDKTFSGKNPGNIVLFAFTRTEAV